MLLCVPKVMRAIRRLLCLATLAALPPSALVAADGGEGCAPPGSGELVGYWESVDRSRGSLGKMLELRPDGSFIEGMAVMLDRFYRVEGDRVAVGERPLARMEDADQVLGFAVEGSALVQDFPAPGLRKQRFGVEAGELPIVGVWRYRHPAGPVAFERYTAEGRFLLRMPVTSAAGCYTASQRKLVFRRLRSRAVDHRYELDGDRLVMRIDGSEPTSFRRVTEGRWFGPETTAGRPPG